MDGNSFVNMRSRENQLLDIGFSTIDGDFYLPELEWIITEFQVYHLTEANWSFLTQIIEDELSNILKPYKQELGL